MDLSVQGSPAGKLNLQISIDGRRCGSRFGQAGAHGDYRKLRATRNLNHMKVAVAVPRIKRLHGYRDQEIALSVVANALASRRMAHTLRLMQWVRHMVGERALFEESLAVRSKRGEGYEQEHDQYFLIHKLCSELKRNRKKSSPKRDGRHDGHLF